MNLTFLASATVLIDLGGVKVLTDPWLYDGAFYGSWCHYPPVDADSIDLTGIDYVYLSHIHPDHFDPETFRRKIAKSTPVLIHRYDRPFLKRNIERLGYEAIEVAHGERFALSPQASISIYGADDCDPSICGRMFGCVAGGAPRGSMQLDSLCVFHDGQHVLVNTNDCPFEISHKALKRLKAEFTTIDMAMVGYSSASLFPHCMIGYDADTMGRAKQVAIRRGLESARQTLEVLLPKYYMPFAGTYVLGGAVASKTQNMPIVELPKVVEQFAQNEQLMTANVRPVLLNHGESFDLATETASKPYTPIDPAQRDRHVQSILADRQLAYEADEMPTLSRFEEIMGPAFERFDAKRREIGMTEDHTVFFALPEGRTLRLRLDGTPCNIELQKEPEGRYSFFQVDPRLLLRVLRGPAFANWNNVEIGAHVGFKRDPDVYNPQMHIVLNHFHQ